MAEKKAQKAAGAQRAANTFEVVAREWLEVWKADKVASHAVRVMRRLEKDVFPLLGKRPVADVNSQEIMSVLERVQARGAIDTAHRVKDSISQVINFAKRTGRREKENPCLDLQGALRPVKERHFPALTDPAEVAELLRDIDSYGNNPIVRAALRLLALVFVRPGDLRTAKWTDIDLDRARWEFVTAKRKVELVVPLARQAVEIFRDLRLLTGGREYVFTINAGEPISNGTLNKALRIMGYDTKTEHTAHGFRAMARTMLAERLNFPAEVIEHQLAHVVPDILRAAYNRTKFLEQRVTMMQTWADYLDKLREGRIAGVFPFPAAG